MTAIWTDPKTNLQWSKSSKDPMIWERAKSWCKNLGKGWGLPTIKELITIIDYETKDNPAVCEELKDTTAASSYWSSTTYANFPFIVWVVLFGNGYVNLDFKINPNYVRAVRG